MTDILGYPLKFQPIAKERLWGGDRLAPIFQLESKATIGEIWTLSDHPSDPSICIEGPVEVKGKSLSEIIRLYPKLYLGKKQSERFPLLIKFLHANDDLSVQIHPDDAYGLSVEGDFGKTEAWYILDAEDRAQINYGHKFRNKEEYYRAIDEKKVRNYLTYKPVSKGDFIFVPSRTLHALLKGTMVLEIQQSSDVTYRVYDWDRVDANGNPRELHIDKAADVMVYEEQASTATEPKTIYKNTTVEHLKMVECPYFHIEKIELIGSINYSISQGNQGNPDVLIVAEGEGSLIFTQPETGEQSKLLLRQGDTVLIPTILEEYQVGTTRTLTLLRTFY